MKTIIAPTDFSEISLNAVKYAADMACVLSTNLAILHVVVVPQNINYTSPPLVSVSELLEGAEKELDLLRDKMLTRTENKITVSVKAVVGDVVPAIQDYSISLNTYAIVMGAETTNSLEELIFGAKTIASIKSLSHPLIVVPDKVQFTSLKKIALACDFREVIETIPVKEIESILKACSAEFYVLHVSPDSGNYFSEETEDEAGWLQEIIGGLKPKYRFIEGKDVEKGIIDFADKNEIDLLIVIPKKRSLIGKLFHRSHSKQLVLQSHVPVMAIHE